MSMFYYSHILHIFIYTPLTFSILFPCSQPFYFRAQQVFLSSLHSRHFFLSENFLNCCNRREKNNWLTETFTVERCCVLLKINSFVWETFLPRGKQAHQQGVVWKNLHKSLCSMLCEVYGNERETRRWTRVCMVESAVQIPAWQFSVSTKNKHRETKRGILYNAEFNARAKTLGSNESNVNELWAKGKIKMPRSFAD